MRGLTIALSLLLLLWAVPAAAGEASLFTLWPLVDYRSSENAEYRSLHLLGPLLKHERKRAEREYGLRPLFYRAVDDAGVSQTEILYPLFAHQREKERSGFHLFHLLSYDYGSRESGSGNRSYLFPFVFHGKDPVKGRYLAVFPVGGTLRNWFGRDEISFTLFPLYGSSRRGETVTRHILWPFFSQTTGGGESGLKLWPLYGRSDRDGVHRKRFYLWPVFFSESLRLDGDDPLERRAAWPLYVSLESRESSYRAWLWPFFSRTENRAKGYRSWNAPWPLVRITRGERYHGVKLLPFYADETMDVKRQRWYLWPVYKVEELKTDLVERRRDRLVFFLYSDLREEKPDTGDSLRRIALWPLFGYERRNAVSHLHLLALVEPFFPGNRAIERSWAPLWRVYQQKWDRHGNRVVSLLWNLFWLERQGEQLAWELFPLVDYRREADNDRELRLLKGLFRYRAHGGGKTLNLFYLPWGVNWGGKAPGPA